MTDDNKKYLKSAEIDENNRLKVEGNWLGTTTLTITDAAGKELDLPVTVMPMAALLESDRCFKIDIKKFVESNQDLNNMRQLTLNGILSYILTFFTVIYRVGRCFPASLRE